MAKASKEETLRERRKLQYAAAFCLVFMFVEIVGGIVAGSVAIMTDAAHMLADVGKRRHIIVVIGIDDPTSLHIGGLLVGIFAQGMVSRAATESHTFGFHRAEVLGALLSVVIIWGMTGGLFYAAILRTIDWFNGEAEPVNGKVRQAFFRSHFLNFGFLLV
jgi:zinc transporter 2